MLKYEKYKDKVLGCFLGKNIGGTLGAPFECRRGVFEVDYYTQPLNGEPLPNDDLDLQLVWLNAIERFGRNVDARILGEYWLLFITPNWSEYGAAKNNMRMGLEPPLSGYVNNLNRDSNGAFIRTEIWACLAPGHPDIAVEYATRDAMVDHSEEGIWAARFCAAVESAAFIEDDRRQLVEIGLSYIPRDCAVYRAVRLVNELYEQGEDWKTVRKALLNEFPSYFGTMVDYDPAAEPDIPMGRIGYDAPANIGLMMTGWVYGEGDFSQSLCIAASCGEDADCTSATLGALYGILLGAQNLPDKWLRPIGHSIQTLCINKGDGGCCIPSSVDELTDRICALIPSFLREYADVSGSHFSIIPSKRLLSKLEIEGLGNFTLSHHFPLMDISVNLGSVPVLEKGKIFHIGIDIHNLFNCQQWFRLYWVIDEGFEVLPGRDMMHCLEQNHGNIGHLYLEYTLKVPEVLSRDKYEAVLCFYLNGRHTKYFVPLTFINTRKASEDK